MRYVIRSTTMLAATVLFATAAHAVTISTCQAAKTRCVSKALGCLLGCHAKAEEAGFLDGRCVFRCRQKFDGNLRTPADPGAGCIQKLQSRGNCLTGDETAAMTAKIDAFVAGVVCDLDPSAGTCSAPAPTVPSADCGGAGTPTPTSTPNGTSGPKHVFLSSADFAADLGGVSGADAACQDLASAAGLSGTYRAWVSDGSSSPATRFTHATGPYVLVDNVSTVANDWSDLVDGVLASPIVMTESGTALDNVDVWTGTASNGQSGGTSCFAWTSTDLFETALAGLAKTGVLAWWSQYETLPCDGIAHLYCFEQ